MNAMIRKAKAGVTLVELLVVILIVTILSVSMLPLLQPFVIESQYAAEAIPVIGNLRTKIGVYQYDKGQLPSVWGGNMFPSSKPQIETWGPSTTAIGSIGTDGDFFLQATLDYGTATAVGTPKKYTRATTEKEKYGHIGSLCDIDYQDLKGKRSKPNHYQYLVVSNGADYVYCVGCFGDNNGLKKGTGYAVCEIVLKNHKYVGTWKRYKPLTDSQICFTSDYNTKAPNRSDPKDTAGCYVPKQEDFQSTSEVAGTGTLAIITTMKTYGWDF